MDIFDGYYYKSCKWFLGLIGLWPYQTSHRRQISQCVFYLINATLAVPQSILLAQLWGKDFNVTMENSVSVMFTIGCISKYIVTFTSSKRLQLLFVQIAKDWQRITDETELEILRKYTAEGRFLVYFYTVYVFCAWVVYTLMPFAPFFLDIAFPLNASRPLLLPFYANYVFFDQMDYHYWACGHIAFVYFSSFILFSGVDTTFVITVKHTCGLFAIICHRLESIKSPKDSEAIALIRNRYVVNNTRSAIILHYETIRCAGLLEDSFSTCFLVLQSMSVIGLAVSGVYFLYIYNDAFKFLRVFAFFIGLIIHLLYVNWVGQQIIDSSEAVFDSAYSSKWYLVSTKVRTYTSIILIRAFLPCQLTAGKITVLSMESFGILIKTAMSYFTVILSVT